MSRFIQFFSFFALAFLPFRFEHPRFEQLARFEEQLVRVPKRNPPISSNQFGRH